MLQPPAIPHDIALDRCKAFCLHTGLKAIIEPTNVLRVRATGQATEKRPDIAVDNLDDLGRTVFLLVATTDAGAACNVISHRSSVAPGRSASASDEAVFTLVDPAMQFQSLAIELYGRWGPSALRLSPWSKRGHPNPQGLTGSLLCQLRWILAPRYLRRPPE